MHREGAAPYDSSGAVSAGSLGDMEAKEEAQAADTSLPEREATAVEPEPTSPSSPGESGGGPHRPGPAPWAAPHPRNFTRASAHICWILYCFYLFHGSNLLILQKCLLGIHTTCVF